MNRTEEDAPLIQGKGATVFKKDLGMAENSQFLLNCVSKYQEDEVHEG